MSGLFSDDGTGWIHDCDFPKPEPGATFVCPECGVKHFTAVHREFHQWVWISEETGKARI